MNKNLKEYYEFEIEFGYSIAMETVKTVFPYIMKYMGIEDLYFDSVFLYESNEVPNLMFKNEKIIYGISNSVSNEIMDQNSSYINDIPFNKMNLVDISNRILPGKTLTVSVNDTVIHIIVLNYSKILQRFKTRNISSGPLCIEFLEECIRSLLHEVIHVCQWNYNNIKKEEIKDIFVDFKDVDIKNNDSYSIDDMEEHAYEYEQYFLEKLDYEIEIARRILNKHLQLLNFKFVKGVNLSHRNDLDSLIY